MSKSIEAGLHPGLGFLPLKLQRLWTPLNDPLVQMWVDQSDSATLTESSGIVSAVQAKGGPGRILSQGIAASRPNINTETINGLNLLTFDGVNDYLNRNESWNYDNGSHALVFLAKAPSQDGLFIACEGNTATDAPFIGLATSNQLANSEILSSYYRNDAFNTFFNFNNNMGTVFNGLPHIVSVIDSGSNITTRIDGAQAASVNYTRTGVVTLNQFSLGCLLRTTAALFLGGSLGDFTNTFSTSTSVIEQHEGHIAHKYNLASLLPALHPYKDSPPTA